jgi:hypothetical protein
LRVSADPDIELDTNVFELGSLPQGDEMRERHYWAASEDAPAPAAFEGEGLAPVVGWGSQALIAAAFDCTPRWLQKLEKKGIPVDGRKGDPRYPFPHVLVWHTEYLFRQARDGAVAFLEPREAFAEHSKRCAADEKAIDERMARDPLYRLSMEAAMADVDDEPLVAEVAALIDQKIAALKGAAKSSTPQVRRARRSFPTKEVRAHD